ncbi:MAG: hypothetical protein H6508_08390 [Calditrichaeota bacterium]|nr:hypothetical protein [Calditrichota bacterium]MCB9367182.1 hypothetical protein [Calditrichota bacterium]
MKTLLSISLLLALLFGCSTEKKPGQSKEPPLPHMQPSMQALAATVVQAVADSNVDLLYDLVVTKDEYRDVVWVNLDSVEIRGLLLEEVWGWNARDSDKAIARMVGDFAHKEFQMMRLDPPRDTRVRNEIKVHRGNWIHIQERDAPEEDTWRMINVVLEYQGWFKVITYDD